ncbi:MAG: hypothetical protein EHM62_02055 [Methylococcus sp.]|nr:MAG: hypothetical protein EHM62_02055 [Methylococcus sp.]
MITLESLRTLLLWNLAVNTALLCLWFAGFAWAHDALYRWHTRWFRLSPETFDALHYAGMALFKIGIFLLNLAPLLGLYLMGA